MAKYGSARDNSGESGVDSRSSMAESAKQSLVSVWPVVLALSWRLWDCIRVNEYVNSMDLSPARGKGKPLAHSLEGQIPVVEVEDLTLSRKVIPDLPTWLQCFALYIAVILQCQPGRVPHSQLTRVSLQKRARDTSHK